MPDLTSKDILANTEITHRITLTRWHQLGLIPPPRVSLHPSGRGKISYWPEWVLHRCKRILQLQSSGMRLPEILQFLGNDWKAAEREFKRRYVFSEVSETMDRNVAKLNLREKIDDLLRDLVGRLQGFNADSSASVITSEIVDNAIALKERNTNPVLIITNDSVEVTADFLVSHRLSNRRTINDFLLVVPVFNELVEPIGRKKKLPKEPVVRPLEKVESIRNGKSKVHEVAIIDEWDFDISSDT